jgi:hypothetical protein
MSRSDELRAVSEAMAAAAAEGRWDAVSRNLWRRADVLDGVRPGELDGDALRAAARAGEAARAAIRRMRAGLETELLNLRAARRSAGAWRPYREASGGTLDVSS